VSFGAPNTLDEVEGFLDALACELDGLRAATAVARPPRPTPVATA
jgi:hypothetical protein